MTQPVQPRSLLKVINGRSDLFVAVLSDASRHPRSAVGAGSLPNGMTVEIRSIGAFEG